MSKTFCPLNNDFFKRWKKVSLLFKHDDIHQDNEKTYRNFFNEYSSIKQLAGTWFKEQWHTLAFSSVGVLVFLGSFTHSYESVLYNAVMYNFPPTHKPTL